MNKKSTIFIFLLTITLSLFGGGFLAASKHPTSNFLKVGTNAEFAPFSYVEEGEIKGFEIDLAKEVGKKLGRQIKIVDMPFEALIPELRSNSVDFIAAGMTITEERAKVVHFTKPYLDGEPLVACYLEDKVSPESFEDVLNAKIVVNEGYTADYFITDECRKNPLRVSTPVEAVLALKSNRAQAFITARNTISPFYNSNKNPTLRFLPIESTSENCAMLVGKGSTELLESIDQALDELKEEGTINALKEKWGI